MLTHYAHLIQRVDLPMMVDIDTGFGDVNNVIRTVRQVEQMGAAALFIEDQTYPKRCGRMDGKSVVDVDEYLPKLRAALWARKDPDFVIIWPGPTPLPSTAWTRLYGEENCTPKPERTWCLSKPSLPRKTCAGSIPKFPSPAWPT